MKKFIEDFSTFALLIVVVAIGGSIAAFNATKADTFGGGGQEARVNNLGSSLLSSSAISTTGATDQAGLTVLARNVNRNYAKICTTSTDIMYLSFTTTTQTHTAAQGEGMPISVTAGYSNCYVIDSSNMYEGVVYATSSDAGVADVITFIED